MRVIITGITGLVGSHLADYLQLLGEGVEVAGFKRWRSSDESIWHLFGRVRFFEGDVEDSYSVHEAVSSIKPDRRFQLPAQNHPSESWTAPVATIGTNVFGTIHVLEGVRKHCPACREHVAGSSAQYGLVRAEDVPITEAHPLRPLSPYGSSRLPRSCSPLSTTRTWG